MSTRPSAYTTRRVWAALTRRPQASIRELAASLELSYGHVNDALNVLRDAGYIDGPYGSSRARTVLVPLHIAGFRIVRRANS